MISPAAETGIAVGLAVGLVQITTIAVKALAVRKNGKVDPVWSQLIPALEGLSASTAESLKVLRTIANQTCDLHEWHKPDASGRQTWKNQDG